MIDMAGAKEKEGMKPTIRILALATLLISGWAMGADAPSNMQWQTREAAKEKDKWE
jgi:hypothetical protein